jgi:tetratricopeptide (TPR) repeat protein
MLRCIAFTLSFLLMPAPSWAQTVEEYIDGPQIEKLIGEGRYQDAYEFIKSGVQKNEVRQRISATYYAGYGKFYLEVGMLKDAAEALKIADRASGLTGQSFLFTLREQADYQLAQGDYAAAASTAANAYRESSYRKTRSEIYEIKDIVLSYCRSLEALARLRSGDLERAEKIILEALRDVPKNNDSEPLFASRVLFTGCIIESHLGNYPQAQELYRRGMEVLEKKKVDSRDVSLGQLAMAESYLLSGDLPQSRQFAERSMEHTAKMFQPKHQDTVTALELLARIDVKESKLAEAMTHAKAAVDMAVAVFGEGGGGAKAPMKTLQAVTKAAGK